MNDYLIFALIGAGTGWLVAWASKRQLSQVLKCIIFGSIGGLAGGGLIDLLKELATMAGAALGSLILLAYLRKK